MKKIVIKTLTYNDDTIKLAIPIKLDADIYEYTNVYVLTQIIKQLNKQVKSLKKQLTTLQKQVSCEGKEENK